MPDYKCHTPEGVTDYLPDECMAKNQIEQSLQTTFYSYGYRRVQTPVIEYHDIYAAASGDISSEKLFKFFDPQGRILALRGDITTSIARMMGTKWGAAPLPARLCYVAEAFRYNGSSSSLPSEFTQAGIELIGAGGAAADAEIIIVAITALLDAGISEFQIDIGQVSFFKGLAGQIGLSAEDTEKMCTLIDHKDSVGIAEVIAKYSADSEIKDLMLSIPDLFGGEEVLSCADSPRLNALSRSALSNLRQVYDIIKGCGLETYISLDLGMLQSIDYYTGVIFKGFTYGVGFAICGGGRYDALIENFGADMAAVGLAISVNRVLAAMQRQKKPLASPITHILLWTDTANAASYDTGQKLRRAGLIVENYLGEGDTEAALAYANAHGIGAVAAPLPGGSLQMLYCDGRRRIITAAELEGGDLL